THSRAAGFFFLPPKRELARSRTGLPFFSKKKPYPLGENANQNNLGCFSILGSKFLSSIFRMGFVIASRSYAFNVKKPFEISRTCFHDNAVMWRLPQRILPPCFVATIAIESVSSMAYVPPFSRTHNSRSPNMSLAPLVMREANGGKQNSPGC